MSLDVPRTGQLVQQFDFARLFIEELGWSRPTGRGPVTLNVEDQAFKLAFVAELAGVGVLEGTNPHGGGPAAKMRAAVHKEVSKRHRENLLIFIDQKRTQ